MPYNHKTEEYETHLTKLVSLSTRAKKMTLRTFKADYFVGIESRPEYYALFPLKY